MLVAAPAKFGGHTHYVSGDMFLTCHMNLCDHVF